VSVPIVVRQALVDLDSMLATASASEEKANGMH